jgi:sugar-specific transcriptional regulator TrmB
MDAEQLMLLGLTKREAGAYVALLRLQEAKAGEVAQFAKEDRTNIYDSLRSLVKKGLANTVIKDNTTYYRVAPPERLYEFIQEKERALDKVMPEIKRTYNSFTPQPLIEVYEGREGLKTVLNDILRVGKDFVAFGATDRMKTLFPEYTKHYLRERLKKKIRARQLYPRGEKVLESPLSKFCAVPKEYSGPATTIIYAHNVAIFMWFTEPPVVVVIRNKEAAEAYKSQFEMLWFLLGKSNSKSR